MFIAIFPFFKREMRIKRLFELIEVIVRELHHDLKMGSITPQWLAILTGKMMVF